MPDNLSPSLGFWRSWSLVVGSVVGSGVFLMPTVLAPYGGLGILSVALAGIAGLCIAMTFSGLSTQVRGSGGPKRPFTIDRRLSRSSR